MTKPGGIGIAELAREGHGRDFGSREDRADEHHRQGDQPHGAQENR